MKLSIQSELSKAVFSQPVTIIDRSAINTALSKAIAYKNCGKDHEAKAWAAELINLLSYKEILSEDYK